jgi:cell wall-associated NlpC family hydrolase
VAARIALRPGLAIRPTKRHAILAALCFLAVLPLAGPAAPAPPIEAKQAEAEQVIAQIEQIDHELELAVEAYNAAEVELDRIRAEQKENQRKLEIARANFGTAQRNLDERLVELYMQGNQDVLEVLLGATSLDELLDRIETANRVSDQDAGIVEEVRKYRTEVKEREEQLAEARQRQEEVVAERAERRRDIEGQLAERQQLLASIRSEIERLKAEEAARQRQLEAQARARLAAQQSQSDSGSQTETQAAPVAPVAEAASTTSAPAAQYGGVVGIAMQYLGIPYQWGGSSPSTGFDCSGFTMFVFSQVGVSLPHSAAAQYGMGSAVSQSALQPGDLVFFNGLGHVGIYIGGNQFIHSPHTGDVVKISSISGWYSDTWVGARRL